MLVHIQQLEKQFSPATGFLELIEQVAYPSFLKLLECYHHDASCTLIWELTQVSVSHILASSCSITTDELVLEGIQYLRGLGRALATLGPETILLTQSGDVKISEVSAGIAKIDKN
ncbi:unnamed protein product [Penicillium nalgiovense]|nr:unnamed protein product [Penicillium nalgiovense]